MQTTGTVIGKGISIHGEISAAEDIFLDGVVDGAITLAEKRLTVGANGLAQADIVTGDLVVFGRVAGSVQAAARVELKHSAAFVGDITAARLSVEDNATLQGYVDLTQSAAPKKPSSAAEEEADQLESDLEAMEPQLSHAV